MPPACLVSPMTMFADDVRATGALGVPPQSRDVKSVSMTV